MSHLLFLFLDRAAAGFGDRLLSLCGWSDFLGFPDHRGFLRLFSCGLFSYISLGSLLSLLCYYTWSAYTIDSEFGEGLSVSYPAAVAHLGFVFHAENLSAAAVSFRCAGYFGALDKGLTPDELISVADSQHAVELNSTPLGDFQRFNLQAFARTDLILFTTGFNYGVNSNTSA